MTIFYVSRIYLNTYIMRRIYIKRRVLAFINDNAYQPKYSKKFYVRMKNLFEITDTAHVVIKIYCKDN